MNGIPQQNCWKVSARCTFAVQSYYIEDVSKGVPPFQKVFLRFRTCSYVSEGVTWHAAMKSYYI
jgi:hypothetical protein